MEEEIDFGNGYLEFYEAVDGVDASGLEIEESQVCIDGWFTSKQLRNIANELDRLENEMKNKTAPAENG